MLDPVLKRRYKLELAGLGKETVAVGLRVIHSNEQLNWDDTPTLVDEHLRRFSIDDP